MSEFTLTLVTDASPDELSAVQAALFDYNERATVDARYQPLTIIVRDADGQVVGGLRGETYWDWLYVDTLALRDEARQQGIGTRLLVMAEQEAIARGCHSAYLDTFSFQALPFYQKHGYEIFGTLDNYPGEHKRYFLRKELNSTGRHSSIMADTDSSQSSASNMAEAPRTPERKATLRLAQHHLTYISMVVVLLVVIPLLWGIYRSFLGFKAQRDTVIAQDNLHAIYSAITSGYTEDHDGRLPPADRWTEEIAGYLSAPPNKPGGKMGYLHGPGDGEEVGYVYNDLASDYEFSPKAAFGKAAEAGRNNQQRERERIAPDRLILLIEQPGAAPNAHMKIPPPDSIQNQQDLYKLLAFPHNHDDPDGAKTVILYASGKIDIVTRKDLRP